MKIIVRPTSAELGAAAAQDAADMISAAIREHGECRIVLSTGASQLPMLERLITLEVDWTKVTAFHLDEYIGIPETHAASFRKYLKERFASKVPLRAFNYVVPEGDLAANVAALTAKLREKPIDVGFIGIGENGHIAFNDPPADMENGNAYIAVDLNDACKRQQVREGWFPTTDDVPKQAVSMTVREILKCRRIISFVPYAVKAEAIRRTLTADEVTALVPATALKTHKDVRLYLDADSSSLVKELLGNYAEN